MKKYANASVICGILYWCMADEIGEEEHITRIFICMVSMPFALRPSRKNLMVDILKMAKGTAQQNKDYVAKDGKWLNDRKHETCVDGSFYEIGECPVERQGKRNDLDDLYAMIKEGLSKCNHILDIFFHA
ncbi:MAG: hypothetical protein V8S58_14620 [Lachnospiraceae bacterium]